MIKHQSKLSVDMGGSPASYYAKNLLKQYKNYCYSPSLPERPEPSGKTGRLLYNPEINDELLNYLIIAPNPANEYMNITVLGELVECQIIIYDLMGRAVYGNNLIAGQTTQIDTKNFMNGTYIVELSDSSGFKHSEKLIITR